MYRRAFLVGLFGASTAALFDKPRPISRKTVQSGVQVSINSVRVRGLEEIRFSDPEPVMLDVTSWNDPTPRKIPGVTKAASFTLITRRYVTLPAASPFPVLVQFTDGALSFSAFALSQFTTRDIDDVSRYRTELQLTGAVEFS